MVDQNYSSNKDVYNGRYLQSQEMAGIRKSRFMRNFGPLDVSTNSSSVTFGDK